MTETETKKAKAKSKADDETYAQELRQVEDNWLGKDAPRTPDGRVERGHGSLWVQMTPERRKYHAAIEAAIAAETKVAAAAAAHAAAEAELAAAEKAVDNSQVE